MAHHPSRRLSRRQFLGLAGAGLLSGFAPGLNPGRVPGFAPRLQTESRRRVWLHTFDPAETATGEAIREAVLGVTDLSWLRQGDSVFVKVASNSDNLAPAVTSPYVLADVIQLLREAGAGTIYVGDMSGAMFVRHLADRTIGSTRDCMRANGLLQAAEAAGAEIFCFEEVPFEEAYIPGVPVGSHHWDSDLQVAEILDRVDHIVNLPRLGKHVLAGASLGLKNAVGWISDYSRMVLHRDGASFQEKIAEINAIPQIAEKTRLILTLADRVMTTYGPDQGYPLTLTRPMIIASDDVASHDQIALQTLLWAREQTPAADLAADPYPAQSNGLNWWFVRVTWEEEAAAAYQELPIFTNLAAPDAATQFSAAYESLNGGRPDVIEVVPGGLPPDEDLAALLTGTPELGIELGSAG